MTTFQLAGDKRLHAVRQRRRRSIQGGPHLTRRVTVPLTIVVRVLQSRRIYRSVQLAPLLRHGHSI